MISPYRILDLFAGIGGLSLGFELLSREDGTPVFELACAVEIDKDACDTLRANLARRGKNPNVVVEADLTDPEAHAEVVAKCKGSVDVLVGGPPCQSFSTIGSRSASPAIRAKFLDDSRDRLYLEYIALVRELQPKVIVFENVMGILTKKDANGVKYIDLVTESIRECGYEVGFDGAETPYIRLNAANYGVPQLRERVFLVANRMGILNKIPRATHSPRAIIPGTLPYVTLRDAIGDLPPVQAPTTLFDIPQEQRELVRRSNALLDRGAEERPYHYADFLRHYCSLDIQGRNFLDFVKPQGPNAVLTAHVARGQQRSDLELFKSMEPGTTSKDLILRRDERSRRLRKLIKYNMESFKDKYRKHEWGRPCTTVFAHLQKDGNRFIHPEQARTFTVREAARIQSFPDEFIFTATGNIRFRHIGNAVPPLLAKAIAEQVRSVLSHSKDD